MPMHAPLHRDVQGLVVRIADDLGRRAGLADRGLLEQSPVDPVPCPTTGASAKNRSDFRQNSSRMPIEVGGSVAL